MIETKLVQVSAKLQQALAFHQKGQLVQAQTIYEEILKVQPKDYDALHLLGMIAYQNKNPQRALEFINKAIEISPNNARFYSNRGNVLKELKQLDAALASYDKAIALKTSHAETYHNRGNVLKMLKQLDMALASYDKAIAIKSDYAEAHNNRGIVLKELKQLDAALASYDKAIAIKSDYAEAYYNCGNVLKELKQLDAALAGYDKAIAIKSDYAEAYCNRGNVLKELKQLDAALASYDKAIAINADYAEAYYNRGIIVLLELRQLDAALASFDKAIAIKAAYAEAHFNKSYALLLGGDFFRGWKEFEWRWELDKFQSEKRKFTQPLWLGKDSVTGKTILLHSEQGLGDSIQFCRYAKLVADLGARVILEVQKPLISLLANLDGVSQLVSAGSPLPEFDYQCPLLSLPLAFKTKLNAIPAPTRYLSSDKSKIAQWQTKLGEKTRPRIGLVWSGNTIHKNDHNRSILLADLIPHIPSVCQYISLQKEVREIDIQTLQSNPQILNFADRLIDFSDTAALVECMDVVISVDTSVAHLAGALGKPTWILLPYVPDWRWLLDRDDSPWYSTVELYRQAKNGEWDDVFQRVKIDLGNL